MTGIACALAGGSTSGGTLTSATFTANGTWVAPVGVSLVVSASGKGSAGVSDAAGTVYSAVYFAMQGSVGSPSAPFAQWSTVYNSYNTLLSTLAAKSYPSYAPTNPLPYGSFTYVAPDNTWENDTPTFTGVPYYLTGYSVSTIGSPASGGNITYASLSSSYGLAGWFIDVYG